MAKAKKMDYAAAVALIGETAFQKFAALPTEAHRAYAVVSTTLVKLAKNKAKIEKAKAKADAARAKVDELNAQYEQAVQTGGAKAPRAKKAKAAPAAKASAEPVEPAAKSKAKAKTGARTSGSLAE